MDISHAAELISARDDIVIVCHKNPDGDTLGCGFALFLALKQLGKRAEIRCEHTPGYKFAVWYDLYLSMRDRIAEPGMIVSVDVASDDLIGDKNASLADRIDLAVDHHAINTVTAKERVVDPLAASCTEIVYELIYALGVPIKGRIAEALYVGIITDTGCFMFINTDARTHRIAAALIESGIDHGAINHLFFESKTPMRIAVERTVMDNIQYFCGGRIAVSHLTRAEIAASGIPDSDTDGLPAITRNIEGVEIGIFVKEQKNGLSKVSLRSGGIDSAAICAVFGGGGHRGAAGCELDCPIDEAIKRVVSEAEKYVV